MRIRWLHLRPAQCAVMLTAAFASLLLTAAVPGAEPLQEKWPEPQRDLEQLSRDVIQKNAARARVSVATTFKMPTVRGQEASDLPTKQTYYNKRGQPSAHHYFNEEGTCIKIVKFEFDRDGRLVVERASGDGAHMTQVWKFYPSEGKTEHIRSTMNQQEGTELITRTIAQLDAFENTTELVRSYEKAEVGAESTVFASRREVYTCVQEGQTIVRTYLQEPTDKKEGWFATETYDQHHNQLTLNSGRITPDGHRHRKEETTWLRDAKGRITEKTHIAPEMGNTHERYIYTHKGNTTTRTLQAQNGDTIEQVVTLDSLVIWAQWSASSGTETLYNSLGLPVRERTYEGETLTECDTILYEYYPE